MSTRMRNEMTVGKTDLRCICGCTVLDFTAVQVAEEEKDRRDERRRKRCEAGNADQLAIW